jgi:hypothetical protein
METTLAQQVQEKLEGARRLLGESSAMLLSMGLHQESLACQGVLLDVGFVADGLRGLSGQPSEEAATCH